jgi:Uma2 family endonuclease
MQGIDGLLLAVEVVSKGSEIAGRVVKKAEYAKVGIPHYWIVERDAGNTVHRLTLDVEAGEYVASDRAQPLAWLLTTVPDVR